MLMRHRTRLITAGLVFLAGTGAVRAVQRGAGPGPGQGASPASPIGLIVGRVVDAGTGQPVAEAEVTVALRAVPAAPGAPGAMPPPRPDASSPNVRLLTGADGRFMIRDLPAGNVQLTAKAPGYVNGSHGQIRPGGPPSPILISPENKIVSAS